ncbi:hypothetical protein T11_10659 [Trichinella zimbabwensis]|uniref:Uncharacterized protein n=1 Tax=Trichinella zimbabwensis TaxID=268475 RepID=A0A0V1GAT2_9BILA|nr:hypothetical protein T11_8997 [Trichinella zimbabwensis]KRY95474.1 hypothetical protein T11_10659 [Trichinella zimbabwensis]
MICAASLGTRCVAVGGGLDLALHVLINVAWLRYQ